MSDEQTETGYLESCCWTFERQHCPGQGCACLCHDQPARRVTRREWESIKIADFERLERERDVATDQNTRTRDALTVVLTTLYDHFETLHRLAMNYPEAQHILSSPRKHNAVVLLEQIIGRLDLATRSPEHGAAGDGQGGGE